MNAALVEIFLCLVVVAACIRPLGGYMARVYIGRSFWLKRYLGWMETGAYRLLGIDPAEEMSARHYLLCVVLFGALGVLFLFGIFRFQHLLPLNPQGFDGVPAALALNIAVSFVTNTNWQSYGGEMTLSYLSQMLGCTVQNFLSAATAMAVAVAVFRGMTRRGADTIGNFWVDMLRGVLYILLPLSLLMALILASQGVVQTLSPYVPFSPLEASPADDSLIAVGPAASQVAIKMLGSNGGGFFAVGGAHPFENPTPLANFLQTALILLIPASMVYTFGAMVGDRRQSLSIFAAMLVLWLPLLVLTLSQETGPNPAIPSVVDQAETGNMEGKDVRIGAARSAFWAAAATATSNGSTNAAHGSFMPLSTLSLLLLIQMGEVTFGGVGSGIYGMLAFVLFAVFIGGLMVGRTPEYLGKKLGVFEMKMISLILSIPSAATLIGTALAVSTEAGRAAMSVSGAHGFSEMLYTFTSVSHNNGSAMAGFNAQSNFYHFTLALCMVMGRYGIMLPMILVAGALATKNTTPAGPSTMPTHTLLFTFLLIVSVLIVGVLIYVPALALGPVAEYLHLVSLGSQP